jgi:hypothetical protein
MRESGERREKKRNLLIRQVKLFICFETYTSKHSLNVNTLKARTTWLENVSLTT